MKRIFFALSALLLIFVLFIMLNQGEDEFDSLPILSPTTNPTDTTAPKDTGTQTGTPTAWDVPSVTPVTITPSPTGNHSAIKHALAAAN